jgi:hypothetical protein
MLLLEVYVQGVSRFLAPFKFPLTKGYNAVYGGNDSGKSVLAQALTATFDPDFAAQAAPRLGPVVPQDTPARYGALFEHNGERYRLLRDVGGGVNLARFNAQSQKFDALARDEAAVQAFLQDQLDFPMNGLHAQLGLIDRRPMAGGAGPAAEAASAFGTSSASFDYGDEPASDEPKPDIEAQIKQLQRELKILGSVDDLEFRVDGLQKKKFETEAALAKYRDADQKLEAIAKRSEDIKDIERLTPELEGRVKNLQKQEEYQRQKLQALDQEIRNLERELDVLEPKSKKKFHKDPLFIAGGVVALIGFVLPFFTSEFLVVVGFAAAGWLVYLALMLYPKIDGRIEELNRKYKPKVAEEEKIKKDFESSTGVIKDLVVKLKVIDAKDLIDVAAEWRKLREEEAGWRKMKDELAKGTGDAAKLRGELARQEAEIQLFEEELRNAGAITRDAIQIKVDLERLEKARDAGLTTTAPAKAAPLSLAGPVSPEASPAGGFHAGALIKAAADVARQDVADVTAAANEKINVYLRAFTNGKLAQAELTPEGGFSVARADLGGQRVGLAQLSEGSRDTVLAALRLGLLEAILPYRAFPVILDDPFALLDDQRQIVAAKAVKRIAALTQVVHFTPQKSFLAAADNKVELKEAVISPPTFSRPG